FQAEDGIRDPLVTGVQTCALPIYRAGAFGDAHATRRGRKPNLRTAKRGSGGRVSAAGLLDPTLLLEVAQNPVEVVWLDPHLLGRSEERRVGKECRSRWSTGDTRTE